MIIPSSFSWLTSFPHYLMAPQSERRGKAWLIERAIVDTVNDKNDKEEADLKFFHLFSRFYLRL
ncbi:MAG: hypothetical protein DRH11_11525 [Deltaproteobacteria bacterium]|nr:MAG: hypothetical protein DRH11_11525 [Deltaproteobacteria bacterium]